MSPHVLLKTTSLEVVLGDLRLRYPGLSLGPGEMLLITGPNGSGKTTLLKLLGGFLSPTEGEVRVRGRTFLVLEGTGYDPDMRVYDLLKVVSGLSRSRDKDELSNWIEAFQLGEVTRLRLRELSRGWLKRVLTCCALLSGADVLMLDEPFDGLDESSRTVIRRGLAEACESGRGVVLTSAVDLPDLKELSSQARLSVIRLSDEVMRLR